MNIEHHAEMIEKLQYRFNQLCKYQEENIPDELRWEREVYRLALERLGNHHLPAGGKMMIPDNEPCAGSPDFIWLQVGCDSGEPNVWPERAWDHVTWNDDRMHNDDVLYVNASLLNKTTIDEM